MTKITVGGGSGVSRGGTLRLQGTYAGQFDPSAGLPPSGTGKNGAILKGDYWDASGAGTIIGLSPFELFTEGDLIYSLANNADDVSEFLGNKGTGGGGGGSGDVVGPASATDSNFAAFDTTTGKLIKDSGSKAADFDAAGSASTVQGNLDTHTSNTSNPHSVTKSQVGLSNVDNTSDASKPVSTATQTALNLKADLISPTLVTPDLGTPSALVGTNISGTATSLTSGITNALKSATTTVDVSSATAPATGQVLTATGSTAATWQTPSGGGSGALSALTAATGSNTINNAANTQEWQWNTLGAATGLLLSSSATDAASNTQTVFRVDQTGANASSTQTTYAGYFSNTKTGTASTNVGLYAGASGGTTNYAIVANGTIAQYDGAGSNLNYFHVTASTWRFRAANILYIYSGANIIANFSNSAIIFNSGPTQLMNISSSGVVIGSGTVTTDAILDIQSTTKAFIPPRMTEAQRDAIGTPSAGMVVYNTTTGVLNFHNGSAWGAV